MHWVVWLAVGIFGDRQGVPKALVPHIITSYTSEYPGLATLRCYASRHGYPLLEETDAPCGGATNVYFRKVCLVRNYLRSTPPGTWVLFTDADVAVLNPHKRLEDFIDDHFDMIVYERFHNNEIMSGVYLVRHTQWALRLMQQWLDLRHRNIANWDNGAFNALLANDPKCTEAGVQAQGQSQDHYWKFVSICKQAMGMLDCSPWGKPRTCRDGHVKVLRRGHGPALDFFVMGPGHGTFEDQGGVSWPWGLFIHGVKPHGHRLLGVITGCSIHMPTKLNFADALTMMNRRDIERRSISFHRASFLHCSDKH